MLAIFGILLLLQAVVPLGLLAWQLIVPDRTVAGWLVRTTVIAAYLAAIHEIGVWLVLPWYTALGFLALHAAVALVRLPRIRALPWRRATVSWASVIVRGALFVAAVFAFVAMAGARTPPADTVVDLEFPLAGGTYLVVAGGSAPVLNAHLATLTDDRFRAWRGQSYAVDIVRLGPGGLRADGVLPDDPSRYAIWGDPVYAPCAGIVVQVDNDAPDMPPPQTDRTRMPGNHVLLDCDGVHVLLAHLQQGSVRVEPSQAVSVGTLLGVAGNSGNTSEPHLHVHAQRPAAPGDEPLSGDPLPVRFDGRYLVRNDRVASSRPPGVNWRSVAPGRRLAPFFRGRLFVLRAADFDRHRLDEHVDGAPRPKLQPSERVARHLGQHERRTDGDLHDGFVVAVADVNRRDRSGQHVVQAESSGRA